MNGAGSVQLRFLGLLKRSPRTALRDDLVDEQVQENYRLLAKCTTPDDLNACFKQLKDVYGDEGLDESKALIERKLNDIQAWLAEPRRLPNDERVLTVFREDEIPSLNLHVKRLERTLNNAILRIKQMAIDELEQWQANPSQVISDLRILSNAYDGVATEGVTTTPAFINFREQEEKLFLIKRRIQEKSVEDPTYPFGYLVELQQLESEIAQTVSTVESRALIHLMNNLVALQNATQALRVDLQKNHAAANALAANSTHAEAQWAEIRAELEAYRHQLQAAAGAIPVVLGATLAVSGLALSAACFFNARPPHLPAAGEAAIDRGLGV